MSVNLFDQLQSTLGGAYRLERELGGGGMSRVFLAHETALGRRVVVKVLLPELAAGVSMDRFRREIQLAAQLQHPHIVPLLAAGEFDGLPYFTMPYIVGESLRVRLARSGELPVNEAVRILRDVVSALAYAHENGVMHRDVKPDNVLLSGGVAVVTDFGVAKALSASASVAGPTTSGLTSLGVALGTPNYMAPEQASGDPQIDHRADIYALGVMAYEMLAGRTPFWGRAAQAVLAAHMVETPESVDRLRPSLAPALTALVMQCLAKRPADRPQSAGEVLHVLDAISTPTGGTATTTVVAVPPAPAPASPSRSRLAVPVAAGLALVALLAVGLLWQRDTSPSSDGATAPTPAPAATPPPPTPVPALPESLVTPASPPEPAPVKRRSAPVRTTEPRPAVTAPPPPPPPRPQPESAALVADTTPPAPAAAAESTTPEPVAPQPVAPQPMTPEPVAPKPPPPAAPEPPRDPRPEISATVAAYASAIESRSVDNMRRVYPGMTLLQQRGWQQFFETVRDVKAQLSVGSLDLTNGTADARVSGTYSYVNNTTGRADVQAVSFRATLRREGGGWRITQVR